MEMAKRIMTIGPDNKEYRFKLRVVELEKIKMETSDFQPRDRKRIASTMQVEEIARKLNPGRLTGTETLAEGAPITTPDLQMLAGFGRCQALKLAVNRPQFAAYRKHLVGLGHTEAAEMETPVLVRIADNGADLAELSLLSNRPSIAGYSRPEQARLDADAIPDAVLQDLSPGAGTLRDAILSARNISVIRKIIEKISAGDVSSLMDPRAGLSRQGVERIVAALTVKVYSSQFSTRLLEDPDPNVKNALGALEDTLPVVARLEGRIKAGLIAPAFSIAPDIIRVIEAWSNIRAKGLKLQEYLNQTTLFGDELTEFQKEVLKDFVDRARSRRQLRELIEDYVSQTSHLTAPGQIEVFDHSHKKEDLWQTARKERDPNILFTNAPIEESKAEPKAPSARATLARQVWQTYGANCPSCGRRFLMPKDISIKGREVCNKCRPAYIRKQKGSRRAMAGASR